MGLISRRGKRVEAIDKKKRKKKGEMAQQLSINKFLYSGARVLPSLFKNSFVLLIVAASSAS